MSPIVDRLIATTARQWFGTLALPRCPLPPAPAAGLDARAAGLEAQAAGLDAQADVVVLCMLARAARHGLRSAAPPPRSCAGLGALHAPRLRSRAGSD